MQGTRLHRAEGKIAKRAPALASILIACDEMMAPGPTKGQRLPKNPISSQAAPRYIVIPASSRRGRVPPPPLRPPVFGSASMSANVFCFDQQNCTGTGADGNRKQIEPGWKCLKRNTQRAGAKSSARRVPCSTKQRFAPDLRTSNTHAAGESPPCPPVPAKAHAGPSLFISVAVACALPGPLSQIHP